MMDVAMFGVGGLTGLALWRLLLGPLFHGFMHGLMGLDDPAGRRPAR
jgi:hypothetical protein